MRSLKTAILFFLLASCAMAERTGSAKNKFQCNNAPSEVFEDCRKTLASGQTFYYKFVEKESDCQVLSTDTNKTLPCRLAAKNGTDYAVPTTPSKPQCSEQADPSTASAESTQELKRIANSTDRMALVMTIELAVAAASAVCALIVILAR